MLNSGIVMNIVLFEYFDKTYTKQIVLYVIKLIIFNTMLLTYYHTYYYMRHN